MRTLILGGVKSGKSRLAEQLANRHSDAVTLIATGAAHDAEMAERIKLHQRTRASHWRTIEEQLSVADVLQSLNTTDAPTVVVDCMTLWLTNLAMDSDESRLDTEKRAFLKAVECFRGRLLIVSNETNMGIIPMGELSRRFCDEVGLLHQALAACCDQVILCVAGLPHYLKGQALD